MSEVFGHSEDNCICLTNAAKILKKQRNLKKVKVVIWLKKVQNNISPLNIKYVFINKKKFSGFMHLK